MSTTRATSLPIGSPTASKSTPKDSQPFGERLQQWLPQIVLAPTFVVALICIYGYIVITAVLSATNSRLLPRYDTFVGWMQYERLLNSERWMTASWNLVIFGGLFILICLALGLLLAIFLDQKIRFEGAIRTIYLYPMALSFIVTGTAWKWLLNPELGIENLLQSWGFENASFDWLVTQEMAIYCVVIAAVWQSSGFVMALFLAGLRGIDDSMIKAAQLDGASMPKIYRRIILPSMGPVFFSTLIMLAHIAIKSFDLIKALTDGGPGYSTDVPATFMYAMTFTRGQVGLGSASAMMMLAGVSAILVPYLYSELRSSKHG